MVEEMLASMEAYFPSIRKEVVEYEIIDKYELIVILTDGSRFTFDYLNKSIRRLPSASHSPNEDDYKREFGMRLRKIMFIKGWTSNMLSEKTGIPQPQISGYITGRHSPSFYRVEKIAEAIGCSLDDLRYR